MRALITAAALTLSLLASAEAAPHRLRVHPNSALRAFSITEGADGFLWLAAADGLYRFDGYHFHKITSFPFTSARFAAFTHDGSLWCGGLEGLARCVENRFQVLLTEEVHSLAAYPDKVFVRLEALVQIGLDGSMRHLKHPTRRDLLVDPSGRLWSVCIRPERACWIDPNRPDELHSIEIPPGYQEAVRDSQGRLWAADGEKAVLLEDGRPVSRLQRQPSRETRRAGPLIAGRKGQLWFLGETVQGLVVRIGFRDRIDNDRFTPTAGFEDSRGRLWVASTGQGLLEWNPDPEWHRWFPEHFGNESPVQIVRGHDGSMVLATGKNLYRKTASADSWSLLAHGERPYAALLPIEGGFLASIRELGLVRLSPNGRIVEHLKDILTAPYEYREIVRDGKGRIWVGHKRALLRVEERKGSFQLVREDLPGVREGEAAQAVDLEVDDAGRLWAGYAAGIAWLDDQDRWHKLVTDQPVTMVRSFALAGEDIWVAHRRAGSFSLLRQKGEQWNVTLFAGNAGYPPLDTHFLKRDSRGWIWRGSPEGVHISDGRHLAPDDWIHLHAGNGLAGNQTGQYGFFEDIDGSVWVVCAEGVSHLRPEPGWFDAPLAAPPPQITRMEADGRVFLFPEATPQTLPSNTKVLRVDVGTLRASPFRDNALHYRLLPVIEEWRLSSNGSLEFRDLDEKDYTLEVGYTGGGPSTVLTYSFQVGPGSSGLPWARLVGILIAAGSVVLIVRHVPWFEKLKYRIEKGLFLLHRRYGRRNVQGLSTTDYSGETLAGRYQMGRIISRGGFSVVYEASDFLDGNSRLAVKVLNRSSGEQGWIRDRFVHEVAALRSVQHPGVVRILDSWISPAGEPCLAMPFLDGQTLRAALTGIPLDLERVARIVRQLGAALSEVHSRGIIHRDLKPENLILRWPGTYREQAVMIDFGTAGLRPGENELGSTTLMAGSFHYMAPERLTGHYSAASDVFSVGVIFLEMLIGKRLADLNAMFSDAYFKTELELALRTRLGWESAKRLADCLAPAYDPEPRRRPTEIKAWTEELAAALALAPGGTSGSPEARV